VSTIPDASERDALRAEPALHERGLELGDVLGAGGTAVVYRARDTRHERDVAVKILHGHLRSAAAEARFAREIRVAAILRHPHILPLFDSGRLTDGRLFAVMPVAAGRPLSDLIREGPLAIADAVRLARETAEALAYLHGCGFVHRDVKPANILVESGHAVLTDFGLAASAPIPGAADATPSTPDVAGKPSSGERDTKRLTQAGTALGTIPYMSPEALLGEHRLDASADQYALGVVLYEMLTGRLPFDASAPLELLARRAQEPWPDVRAARPEVPTELATLIERCTALDPAARFSSADELAAALAAIALADGSRLLAPPPGHRRLARLLALAALAVIVVIGFSTSRNNRPGARLDPDQVVIADLVNDSGDSATVHLGALAGDIITAAVMAGTRLKVVNADVALPSRMQRTAPVADSSLARQTRRLVERTRSRLVVTGAYFRSGRTHEFVAEVIDARSGRVLGVAGPVRAASADPDPALRILADRVVAILRQKASTLD